MEHQELITEKSPNKQKNPQESSAELYFSGDPWKLMGTGMNPRNCQAFIIYSKKLKSEIIPLAVVKLELLPRVLLVLDKS